MCAPPSSLTLLASTIILYSKDLPWAKSLAYLQGTLISEKNVEYCWLQEAWEKPVSWF